MRDPRVTSPTISDPHADRRFRDLMNSLGIKPGVWSDGYVEYEWRHIRHMLLKYSAYFEGRPGLEFGCNVGATATVLALMGARVTAVDIKEEYCALTALNASRYGVADAVSTLCVPDTRRLPFESESFDWITCNSVMEYIPDELRAGIQAEAMRVLRPGGLLMVFGTSSRLWPFFRKKNRPRGVRPGQFKRGFGGTEDLLLQDGGSAFFKAKAEIGLHPWIRAAIRLVAALLGPFGYSAGMLMPDMCLILKKRPR